MNKKEFPFAIALTGGIATGKSTLKSLLFLEGFAIIESDIIAHNILDKSTSFINDTFGNEFINNDTADRVKLGSLIFSDDKKKKILEEYMHPKIQDEIKIQANKLEKKKFPYMIDIPLYFETNTFHLASVIVIWTKYEVQITRLMKRNNFTKKEAILRINAQMRIEEKIKKANYVVNNNNNLKFLQNECDLLIEYLNKEFIK